MTSFEKIEKGNLSQQQELFCSEYVKLGDVKKAAVNANYAPKKGYELLRNPIISARIKKLKGALISKSVTDIEELQEILIKMARGNDEEECIAVENVGDGCSKAVKLKKTINPRDRLKAAETLCKLKGLFVDKSENKNLNIDVKTDIEKIQEYFSEK